MASSVDAVAFPVALPDLPSDWEYALLGDLVEDRGICYGIVQPGTVSDNGVPVLRVNNVRNGRIDASDVLRVDPAVEAKFQRSRLRGGEVLLTLVGTLGEVAIVSDSMIGWNVARAVGVLPVLQDPGSHWVAICLRSALCQHCMRSWATTTVQATFNLRDVANLPIPLPPARLREKLAHILGTLDDKIELNRRMNATLEGISRAIFKSWFVDFDPVRQKAAGKQPAGMAAQTAALFPDSFEDSEIGEVPKGWEVMPLPEIVEVNPVRALRKGQTARYLDMANMPTSGHTPDKLIARPFGSGTRFMNGDTLVARITPCLENGKTAFIDCLQADEVAWGSTEFIVLRPYPPLPPEFAYCLARDDGFREFAIQSMTGSSGRQRVPAESLDHFRLARPPAEVAAAFAARVQPYFRRIRAAADESCTLAILRDALLPKLLSGELRVPEAEEAVEEAVR